MANVRIKDLPVVTSTTVGDKVAIDGATTRGITVENLRALSVPVAGNVNMTGGVTQTSYNAGNLTGTITLSGLNGQIQHGSVTAAWKLNKPAAATFIVLEVTNSATAGALDTTDFGVVTGVAYATTNGNKYVMTISKLNSTSSLDIRAAL